jgi:hypothetical protein
MPRSESGSDASSSSSDGSDNERSTIRHLVIPLPVELSDSEGDGVSPSQHKMAMLKQFFTLLPWHRDDLVMCLCAPFLLLKKDGLFRASQAQHTYRVTVVLLSLPDIANAKRSIMAEYMTRNKH